MIISAKSKMAVLVAAFAGLCVCLPADCRAVENGDGEYWQTHTLSYRINGDFAIKATQELRMGRSNSEPHLHNINVGLSYSGLADWIDVSFDFKKEYQKDGMGEFRHENRPHVNVTLKSTIFDLPVSNRSRVEYRDRENRRRVYRFRNKTTVKFPWKLTCLQLQPYISEEFFIGLGKNNVSQNRLSSGVIWKWTDQFSVGFYYLWKKSKISGGWRDTNIIGTDFKLSF